LLLDKEHRYGETESQGGKSGIEVRSGEGRLRKGKKGPG